MIIIDNLDQVANQIETERGIDKHLLYEAIEQSLASACRKRLNDGSHLECKLNLIDGSVQFFRVKEVVDEVLLKNTEILLKDAKKIDNNKCLGDEVKLEFTPPDFGRIAAQVAKQVITQRLREAERESVYEEFISKKHTLINGTVQQQETNNSYLINLGRTEAILRYRDQIPGEQFETNEVVRVYITEVDLNNRRGMIHITRTHPGMLKALFEIEIPEIGDGIIEVMSVSREPGVRAKVAVKTNNPAIGAVGTCVGQMGGRIQAIIKELGNEKIDVLEWDEDIKKFIGNALKPATVTAVLITSITEKQATVVVPNDQLSLAIGRKGVNIRLSVALTGWKLNVINEDEYNANHDALTEKITETALESDTSQDATNSLKGSLAKAISEASAREKNMENTTKILKEKIKNITKQDEQEMKVSDLAKLLNVKTKDLIEKSAEKGIEIKSNRSILTPQQVTDIKEKVFI